MDSKEIYVVTAYRFGDRSGHSYVVGCFNKKHAAIKCADNQTEFRGGKYACFVEKCILNHYDERDINYTADVYKTKSTMCDKNTKV